jgi:hypothetical protein
MSDQRPKRDTMSIKEATGCNRWGILAILGIIIVISIMVTQNDAASAKASGSLTTAKPSCDTAKATELIRKLKAEGIIYKIDVPAGLYPRVYVTEAWQALPMDQKRAVDGVLYCWGSGGGVKDIIVKYYDYRTEKKIALGGRGGLSLQ